MNVAAACVNWEKLQCYIVRIDRLDGSLAGTGFFVAPQTILTCAHVVANVDLVRIDPVDPSLPRALPASVVARSDSHNSRTAFWPFPDLAVIQLTNTLQHRCVRLDPRGPSGRECWTWGFGAIEDGVDPIGSPVQLGFEGAEGNRYFKLSRGQVTPGVSGAPLVCPVRRAVVGAVALTRDKKTDLGGWGSPFGGLVEQSVIGTALEEWGKQIWDYSQKAVVVERESWHRVLPIPYAEHELRQDWTTFQRGPRSCPSDLLRAENGVVPYLFRGTAVEDAVDWCKESTSMGFLAVSGRGGSGKTRFATQLCMRMAEDGWIAGFWREGSKIAQIPLPRLIVFDYTERYDVEKLRTTLDSLREHASDIAPVQVLVLHRTAGKTQYDPFEALSAHAPARLQYFLDNAESQSAVTEKLELHERIDLFGRAQRAFRNKWFGTPQDAVERSETIPNLSGERYELPLDVLFEALDSTLRDEGTSQMDVRPIGRVLAHEQRYWRTPRTPRELDDQQLKYFVAAATLAGANNAAEAQSLLTLVDDVNRPLHQDLRARLALWLHELYPGPRYFNPLVPDRLGEALVTDWLRTFDDVGHAMLRTILLEASESQIAQATDALARLLPKDQPIADVVARVLADVLPALSLRANKAPDSTARAHGGVTLAGALMRLLSADFLERMRNFCPVASLGAVVDAFLAIGNMAQGVGNRIDAQRLYDEALSISLHLAREDPADIEPRRRLAAVYDALGNLSEAGSKPENARKLYREALQIWLDLTRDDPENELNQRSLAVIYDRLGVVANDTKEARELYQESLRIGLCLERRDDQNTTYQRDVALSHERLAELARDAGNPKEARQHYAQALQKYQQLATRNPQPRSLRDLAIVNAQLAAFIRDYGNADEALAQYKFALETFKQLAEQDRESIEYQRDIAITYCRVADLHRDSGRNGEARTLYEQALEIRQNLFERDTTNVIFERDVADSYYQLADLARVSERPADAKKQYLRVLEIRQRLAQRDPENASAQSDLAFAYHRLADLARVRGNQTEARRLYNHELAIRQVLVRLDSESATYLRELAFTYHRLGDLARAEENAPEAIRLYEEALAIRRVHYDRDRESSSVQRDLGFSFLRLGDMARDCGARFDEARRHYRAALRLRRDLASREPHNAGFERDLGVSYHHFGTLALSEGSPKRAAAWYRKALAVRTRLAAVDPANPRFQHDLGATHLRLAQVLESSNLDDEAREHYVKSLAFRRSVVKHDAGNRTYRNELAEVRRAYEAFKKRRAPNVSRVKTEKYDSAGKSAEPAAQEASETSHP